MMEAGTLIVAGLLLFALALAFYLHQTWVVQKTVTMLKRPSALTQDATIVQLSDLHGKTKFLNGSVSGIVNGIKPDIVCVTGDLTNHLWQLPNVLRELGRIRCKHIYFIPGNHEWYDYMWLRKRMYSGEQYAETMNRLRRTGVMVLENECALVPLKGGQIAVCGYDNSFYGNEREARPPANESIAYTIALGHSPEIVDFLQRRRIEYNLLLAGHTHGGQIKLFGFPPGKYDHFHIGHRKLDPNRSFYINRGLGNVLIPLRIGSRPEIAVFRLGAYRK
ncbi:metallophosphoesterase [Paenibacillus sp. MBLB4367]|uniref:metallophosphoesterase n=1 Tax=Paenibacillus sp. MBLB4367 TaxID=3384767 RepID=UPI0039080D4E